MAKEKLTPEEVLKKLEAEKAVVEKIFKVRAEIEQVKEKYSKRKEDTRHKIIIGAKLISDTSNEAKALLKKYEAQLQKEEDERKAAKAAKPQ